MFRVASGVSRLLARASMALRNGDRILYEYYMEGVKQLLMLDGNKMFVGVESLE